ncbi:MAG: hypothetical protein ABSF80_03015 [Chitinispirillaceae bacterium]
MTYSSTIRVLGILIFGFILFFRGELYAAAENYHHPFKPAFLANGSYCEAYKLSALLDDETFIETEMMVTNIGFRDSNAACQILVLHPGEDRWKASKRFGKADWNYSDTPNPALSIGHCRLAQEKDSTICTMVFGNATVTLSFDVAPNPVKIPSTINVSGEKPLLSGKSSTTFYTYEMLIPWSRLNATICLPGRTKKLVSGSGILVDSRSVGYPKDFSRGWVYYYGCLSGCRFLVNFRFPLNDTCGVAGWIWKDNEQTAQPVTNMQVSSGSHMVDGKKGRFVVISSPDSSFRITSQLELDRYSIIDDLGPVLGTIIKLVVGNPVTRFYKAQVTPSPGQPPAQGILEMMKFE